jgi:phosphohistidine phosphatase
MTTDEPTANARVLLLLRHADAGDPAMWDGDDAERPLSSKGRAQAKRLARHLEAVAEGPDVIVTSPKARARQTAKAVRRRLERPLVVDDVLGGPFGLADVAALLQRHPGARRVMLVGHDPDFSALASALTGAPIELKKGAIARIDLADGPTEGGGSLRWLVTPSILAG